MILPALPEFSTAFLPMPSVRQHLMAVRQSLEKACQEIDDQIRALDQRPSAPQAGTSEPTITPSQRLFEISPDAFNLEVLDSASPAESQTETRMVMAATSPTALDPQLEQATLEELNSALSKAFVQMAGKVRW